MTKIDFLIMRRFGSAYAVVMTGGKPELLFSPIDVHGLPLAECEGECAEVTNLGDFKATDALLILKTVNAYFDTSFELREFI